MKDFPWRVLVLSVGFGLAMGNLMIANYHFGAKTPVPFSTNFMMVTGGILMLGACVRQIYLGKRG